ncbi:immune inhibitor A [Vallitalea pronyensis]|uniref:Immune inhibitor A n=1 Tax=Vallitalea pronyensis TaxID=1348613 RepID=A0A8J8MGW4_9FIRM|nr:choice-of-anchor J domain-containing protein [Vallitalea pronyensis]QUI21425.1 immune inhibitor A [Vallitalea pronyensis]
MKRTKIVLSLVLTLSMLFAINVTYVSAAVEDEWDTNRYGDVIDIGPRLRANQKDPDFMEELNKQIRSFAERNDINLMRSKVVENGNFTFNGGNKIFLGHDELGSPYLKTYTLRGIGQHIEVWIADDLTYPDDRPTPEITQEQVDRVVDVFDKTIYPKDTDFFGDTDSHTGNHATLPGMIGLEPDYYVAEDGVERVILLVDNIRDTYYHNPSYPLIIAGFYAPGYQDYFDRNVINLTARSWAERLDEWFGTVAHEFQHLIHDDNDSSEETWLNEGMSDFAEYLCFGTHPQSHVNAFIDKPENSLVTWDEHGDAATGPETLSDYGQAYLLQLYIKDALGEDFIKTLARNEKQGIESVNEVLAQAGEDYDFEELFRRFSIAVAIDTFLPGWGDYYFDSIDVNVNFESALAFDKDGVPAWGADYKVLQADGPIHNIKINGIEFMPIPWQVKEDPVKGTVLWGNNGHLMDNQLIFKADLTGASSPVLTFDTFVDIEPMWDAGMVQVSTDNGNTWTSLANENTVGQDTFPLNDQAPQIYNNLPGLSRNDQAWGSESFDLSTYAGQEVLVGFRYMTDAGYNDTGWFIDNIAIDEIGYSHNCDSLEGFLSIDQIQDTKVEYAVTFINEKKLGSLKFYNVHSVNPFNITEKDSIKLKSFFITGTNYMIVWYPAPIGKKGTVDFTYEIITWEDYINDLFDR